MKLHQDLFPRVCSFENLHRALREARRGKRDREEVAAFEYDAEKNLLDLDSYACRVGKGTHRAVDRCQAFARRHPYVLKADIRKFFPSVDHAILLDLLARRIADPQVTELIRRIVKSGEGVLDEDYVMHWFPGDDLLTPLRPRGLPIGNLTSQFWGNVYLDGLDQHVKRRLGYRAYARRAFGLPEREHPGQREQQRRIWVLVVPHSLSGPECRTSTEGPRVHDGRARGPFPAGRPSQRGGPPCLLP